MRLPQLLVYFDTSPALRLLKSANAPFIIDFLDRQFKHTGRIAISHSELLSALVDYRERTQEAYPDRLPSRADTYLAEWCSPDAVWLRRFLEAGPDEPMYQLTPHTEDVFVFLDRVLDRDLSFVGTESRLKLIADTLTDLVMVRPTDPESRLSHLRQEQQRLQEQIDRIEADGRVVAYAVVHVTGDRLETEFVCIPRPLERSQHADGGPILYRTRHLTRLWAKGERPKVGLQIVEGDPAFSI